MIRYVYIFLISFLISCSGGKEGQQERPLQSLPVIEVQKQDVVGYKMITANIEGTVNDEVRPKISGYITNVYIDEGQRVKKGQLLFKLETLSVSQDALAAKADLESTSIEVEKIKPLVKEGIISERELETAIALQSSSRATYNSVLAQADYGNVRASVNGIVGEIPFRVGSLVSPNDAEPLTTLSELNEVYAYYAMNEKDYLTFLRDTEGNSTQEKIKNFPKVKLVLADDTEYEEEGTVETTTGQIDTQTGTISFRARFSNPKGLLTNGNSGYVKIPQYYKDVLVVPEQSTFEEQTIVYVYTVKASDTVQQKAVKPLTRINNLLLIAEGLGEGDKIVGKGLSKIRDGAAIKPIPTPFDSVATSTKRIFKSN
ncbi:efflux RND transporter periplasmic adaptor subunit [Aggregatimonas sangjinii]|uniref:Efflux RND transporter periplasmic adaptor subunit n=1 Tax=Aggregatimonas sangjinii TaxID=2583587 RepID=A0A5B7SS25_9FLAO|nr:efflux RND transporter periplasmic adaptor subunit [Aggregatimonas sangjinii]QCW99473.1 efflux RND transporter periplasmic adaptor subunit [Aggregatimonas sangjinii]